MKSPVLFLVFNRPEPTAQVFEAIRQAQPPRLYVAADGPRPNREGEAARCEQVRCIATNIDWPCELVTLFRDENLGCKYAVSGAISWFFEQEEEGIILEDDCLPHPDFFRYCDWALNTYRSDHKVWHINGNNFVADKKLFNGKDISFSALAQVWGWATWNIKWSAYQNNPFYLRKDISSSQHNWDLSWIATQNKLNHLNMLIAGLDTWDYQWQITILNHQGLCVCPSSNLISNLGDGIDATHTIKDDRVRLKTESINKLLEVEDPRLNRYLTSWYAKKMGLHSLKNIAKYMIKGFLKQFKSELKNLFCRIFFYRFKKIIIASTGRSASTLLFYSIASSLVGYRFGLKSDSLIKRFIMRYSMGFVSRISDINKIHFPVQKTHDLFDKSYENIAKFIFIYGDPFESVQSVDLITQQRGRIWLDEHLFNLCSKGSLDDLYHKDILNYENQIKTWTSTPSDSVFIIHFDDLWDNVEKLTDFIGFELTLPEKKQRQFKQVVAHYNEAMFEELHKMMQAAKKATDAY